MKRVFLAWKNSCTRTHSQAQHFGAQEIYIFPLDDRRSYTRMLFRYMLSFFLTLRVLYKEKPTIIFTLNQPPFLIAAVFLYSRLFRSRYVLDSHSGAFNDPKWSWFRPIYRQIAARAFLNINTNQQHKTLVEKWGGRSEIISDVPIEHKNSFTVQELPERSIGVVASFSFDEPLAAIWEAAGKCPDVSFYVTGDHRRAPSPLLTDKPANIHLSGYLPTDAYFSLLASVKAVMVLTFRDQTMQRGGYEALSIQQPIITSDWAILRESFGESAVYVQNDAESIAAGIREVLANNAHYRKASARQRDLRRKCFDHTKQIILSLIEQGR